MNAAEVLRVLDALDTAGVRVGVTGGWGIDALLRRQTREHGDVDLGVPSDSVDTAIKALRSLGFAIVADERPARIVLQNPAGKVDLHPIVMLPSGAGVQTGFDGQTFEYPPGSLEAEGEIGGRIGPLRDPGAPGDIPPRLRTHGARPSRHGGPCPRLRADVGAAVLRLRRPPFWDREVAPPPAHRVAVRR